MSSAKANNGLVVYMRLLRFGHDGKNQKRGSVKPKIMMSNEDNSKQNLELGFNTKTTNKLGGQRQLLTMSGSTARIYRIDIAVESQSYDAELVWQIKRGNRIGKRQSSKRIVSPPCFIVVGLVSWTKW